MRPSPAFLTGVPPRFGARARRAMLLGSLAIVGLGCDGKQTPFELNWGIGCIVCGPFGPFGPLLWDQPPLMVGDTLDLVGVYGDPPETTLSVGDSAIVSAVGPGRLVAHAVGVTWVALRDAIGSDTALVTVLPDAPFVESALLGFGEGGGCARRAAGVVCWPTEQPTHANPGRVALLDGGQNLVQVSIENGITGCGITADSVAVCWGGFPGYGSIGVTAVAGTARWLSVTTGLNSACGVRADSTAHCWGNGQYGKLGNGADGGWESAPVAVVGGHKFRSLGVGNAHACGLRVDGVVLCWGENGRGQLGIGTTTSSLTPTVIEGLNTVQRLSVGGSHICALREDGVAFCWGAHENATPWNGTVATALSPTAVPISPLSRISAGTMMTCGLGLDGAAWCWGFLNEREGHLAPQRMQLVPQLVPGGNVFTELEVGHDSACAVSATGDLRCWGINSGLPGSGRLTGSLGDGTLHDRLVPRRVR